MMSRSIRAVGKTRANAYNGYRKFHPAKIDVDLFEATQGHEVDDAVDKYAFTTQGKPGCHADHVMFGNADVEILPGKVSLEPLQAERTMVRCEDDQIQVLRGERVDAVEKRVAHVNVRQRHLGTSATFLVVPGAPDQVLI